MILLQPSYQPTNPHRLSAKTPTALIIKAALNFVPPLFDFSFLLSNLIPLHLPCARSFLLEI
jgi:hypothetical protein